MIRFWHKIKMVLTIARTAGTESVLFTYPYSKYGVHKHYGYIKISEMKYGYVKYTDEYAKSNIWGKEQVRKFFEKSGYGTGMGKDFF